MAAGPRHIGKKIQGTALGAATSCQIFIEHLNEENNWKWRKNSMSLISEFRAELKRCGELNPRHFRVRVRRLVYKDTLLRIDDLKMPDRLTFGLKNVVTGYYRTAFRTDLRIASKHDETIH